MTASLVLSRLATSLSCATLATSSNFAISSPFATICRLDSNHRRLKSTTSFKSLSYSLIAMHKSSQGFISTQHKSRSRYGDGGDEKGQLAARTGYVLRFASHGYGSKSASEQAPRASTASE